MLKKIYQGGNVLTLHDAVDKSLPSPHFGDSKEDIQEAVRILKGHGENDVHLLCADLEASYRMVCGQFREVNAAGGLVCSEGQSLLIFRNGKWDLPKGHQEEGEDISLTAVREVCEETGISVPEIAGLICVTDHCYVYDGEYRLKHTWWYEMKGEKSGREKPQEEEGITMTVWVSEGQLSECLLNTYPSIREVFEKYGFFSNGVKQKQK